MADNLWFVIEAETRSGFVIVKTVEAHNLKEAAIKADKWGSAFFANVRIRALVEWVQDHAIHVKIG